ncbi:MAG: chemotaxis protein CheW [Sulfurimonas sp.]|nr:chemotaxis protein CheW [Sulfurimonas sp.]MDD5202518.1 chemotaxis protein CheW [Sulfurimonas sp.]
MSAAIINDEEEMAIKSGPQYLLFYIHATLFALRAEYISEIVELPKVTKVPWMQKCLKGVCNIRGSVIGVLDIAKYLMDADLSLSEKSALVILLIEFEGIKHRVGIIVDAVREVEVFESHELQETPQFGLPFPVKYIESMAHYHGEYVPVLSLENVVDIEALSLREVIDG